MSKRFFCAALCALVVSPVSAGWTNLWTEDFESVTLGPSPEEAPIPPVPVWTDTPPTGWTVDDSGVPGIGDQENGGIDDWEGWAFVDAAFWVAADDQRRSEFRDGYGEGVVAVADADEWDDVNSPADNIGFYNAFMTSPVIDLTSALSQVRVQFASSWRDEAFDDDGLADTPDDDNTNNQTAILTASYDGGDPVEVLRWESDPDSPYFKDDAPNELIDVALEGGYSTVQFEFGLVNAGNDWWWAVDNIAVQTTPEPSAVVLAALGLLGVVAVKRRV